MLGVCVCGENIIVCVSGVLLKHVFSEFSNECKFTRVIHPTFSTSVKILFELAPAAYNLPDRLVPDLLSLLVKGIQTGVKC